MEKIQATHIKYIVKEVVTRTLEDIVYFEPTIENMQDYLLPNQKIESIEVLESWEVEAATIAETGDSAVLETAEMPGSIPGEEVALDYGSNPSELPGEEDVSEEYY